MNIADINAQTNIPNAKSNSYDSTEKTIADKKYVVKSVFIGDKDIRTALINLAERKAIKEMGLDCFVR